jgi:SNF2 family DNA or RNA helicase
MKLFPHQIDGLKQTQGHSNCALYWDMGLGKTFGGSEKMLEYGNDTNLVICQKSKVNDWVKHFKDQYPDMPVWDLTKKGMVDDFTSRFVAWHGYRGASMAVGVINYELAWRRKDLLDLTDFTLMLDESSLIQNRKAKQTKFIMKLKPKNVILLSGTPTAGKYENLWTQAHLLGWDISEALYNRHYVNWKTVENDGFFHKVVDMENPYKNVDRLRQKFRDHGAVFMKTEDVFDLPEQTFTTVTVPTSKEYRKFMRDSYVEMPDGSELIGDQIFTKRLHGRQLCGMHSQAKLEAFKELIESTNDRVIVFYNFKEEVRQMIKIANDLGKPWGVINGDQKLLAPYENHDDSITFIQYQAGAMGLNLQKANKVIYFTLPERSDLFEQSKARIHRIGQERPCFYWILTCEESLEERIYETLKERKDYTDDLFVEDFL